MTQPIKKLILGGCRSGKSRYAEKWISARFEQKTFVATLERRDDPEMDHRIALHLKTRGDNWQTIEEPVDLCPVLEHGQWETQVFLVDCLTMWITNLIMREMSDSQIEERVAELLQKTKALETSIVYVANEVGLGIVPESALARRFRDLAGWTNQQLGQVCDEVVFVAAGLPMTLKDGK